MPLNAISTERQARLLQHVLLALLVATHAAAWWLISGMESARPAFAQLLWDGLLIAQVSLLAAWAAIGPGYFWLRWPLALLTAAWVLCNVGIAPATWSVSQAGERLAAIYGGEQSWAQLAGSVRWGTQLALLVGALTLVGALLWRVCGIQVRRVDVEPDVPPSRFTLRTLLILTALAALIVWLGPKIRFQPAAPIESNGAIDGSAIFQRIWEVDGEPQGNVVPKGLALWSLAMPFALTSLAAVWVALRPGMPLWRLLVWAAFVPAVGLASTYLCNRSEDRLDMMWWTVVSALFVCGTAGSLRAAGYRLLRLRERRAIAAAATASPAGTSPATATPAPTPAAPNVDSQPATTTVPG